MNADNHIQAIEAALKQSRTKQEFQRVLCVWLKVSLKLTSSEIASAIGWAAASVRRVQAQFRREGVTALLAKPRGGRRRAYISFDRERQIVSKFARRARNGIPLKVEQVAQAYELSVGKQVSLSTIYRLISRHGLRRFLPKMKHSM